MVHADYDFYRNEYFGRAIPAEDFPRLALRGSQYIDYITQGRAAAQVELEAVQMCCCALAEQYQSIEAAAQLAQKSLAAGAAAENRAALLSIARQYLARTGLLYRGGRCGA